MPWQPALNQFLRGCGAEELLIPSSFPCFFSVNGCIVFDCKTDQRNQPALVHRILSPKFTTFQKILTTPTLVRRMRLSLNWHVVHSLRIENVSSSRNNPKNRETDTHLSLLPGNRARNSQHDRRARARVGRRGYAAYLRGRWLYCLSLPNQATVGRTASQMRTDANV
jgi:hypothetical protein